MTSPPGGGSSRHCGADPGPVGAPRPWRGEPAGAPGGGNHAQGDRPAAAHRWPGCRLSRRLPRRPHGPQHRSWLHRGGQGLRRRGAAQRPGGRVPARAAQRSATAAGGDRPQGPPGQGRPRSPRTATRDGLARHPRHHRGRNDRRPGRRTHRRTSWPAPSTRPASATTPPRPRSRPRWPDGLGPAERAPCAGSSAATSTSPSARSSDASSPCCARTACRCPRPTSPPAATASTAAGPPPADRRARRLPLPPLPPRLGERPPPRTPSPRPRRPPPPLHLQRRTRKPGPHARRARPPGARRRRRRRVRELLLLIAVTSSSSSVRTGPW